MKDWLHATDEMIDNMTYQDMIEILEDHIKCGERGGEYSPRKHTVKMYKTCVALLQEKIKNN